MLIFLENVADDVALEGASDSVLSVASDDVILHYIMFMFVKINVHNTKIQLFT